MKECLTILQWEVIIPSKFTITTVYQYYFVHVACYVLQSACLGHNTFSVLLEKEKQLEAAHLVKLGLSANFLKLIFLHYVFGWLKS